VLTFVGLLWTIGVVCLLAAVVGSRLKLPSAEIEAITAPRVRIAVAVIGAAAIALGAVLLAVDSARSQSPVAGPQPTTVPTSNPPAPVDPASTEPAPTTQPTPTPTTTTRTTPPATVEPPPPETPAPRTIGVWWKGSLELGGYGGGPGGGWFLDNSPPARAVGGDLFYNGTNAVAGNAIIEWDGAKLPTWRQCSDLLASNLGRRSVDVRKGDVACLQTADGRIAYVRVDRISSSTDLNPTMTVAVVVWDKE
jgi:hypothetical protein